MKNNNSPITTCGLKQLNSTEVSTPGTASKAPNGDKNSLNIAAKNNHSHLLRIPNNILRSGTLNVAIMQLHKKCPPNLHIAIATLLSFTQTWKIAPPRKT